MCHDPNSPTSPPERVASQRLATQEKPSAEILRLDLTMSGEGLPEFETDVCTTLRGREALCPRLHGGKAFGGCPTGVRPAR